MHPTVKLPFKRYAIGKVYRDGPIKLGRYREFWQADADIVGVPGTLADSEGVLMAADVFKRLDLDVTISFSSRELLKELMDTLDVNPDLRMKAIIALDKLKKVGRAEVIKEMKTAGIPLKKAEELLDLTQSTGSNDEKMARLEQRLKQSHAIKTLREIAAQLKDVPNLVFDPSLARGLTYYTGFFFECTLQKSKISSSLVGTGRYDTMIGQFLGGKQDFAGVGISFGVSVIGDALKEKGIHMPKTTAKVYVVPVTEQERASTIAVASALREAGIPTDMDLLSRSIGKNAAYADALQIPWMMIIGEEEVKKNRVTLKNMKDGKQEAISLDEALKTIQ
jgi:histidyl-tRNA synthetase